MENAKTQGARFPRFGPYCSIDYTAWTGGALFDAYEYQAIKKEPTSKKK